MPIYSPTIAKSTIATQPYYTLDGVDDYFSVTRQIWGVTDTNYDNPWDVSVFAWVRTTSTDSSHTSTANAALNIVGDTHGGVGHGFGIEDGKLRVVHYYGGWDAEESVGTVNDGEWHYVGYTSNRRTGFTKFYIDGVLDTTDLNLNWGTSGTMYVFGWNAIGRGYNGDYFDGDLASVQIFNTLLTDAEVADLYVGLVPDKYNSASSTSLVTNGSFTAADATDPVGNITGWSAYGSVTTRDINSNRLRLVTTAANTGAVWSGSPLVKGQAYRIFATVTGDLGVGALYVAGGVTAVNLSTALGYVDAVVIGTGTTDTLLIYFRTGANTAGTTYYDNFSVVPIGEVHSYTSSSATNYAWMDNTANSLDGNLYGPVLKNESEVFETKQIRQSNNYTGNLWTNINSGNFSYQPHPHELVIENNANNTTNSTAGIFFKAGETTDGGQISAARIAAIRDGAYSAAIGFATRNSSGTMAERMLIEGTGAISLHGGVNLQGVTDQTGVFRSNSTMSISGGTGWFAPAATLHIKQSSADDNDTGLLIDNPNSADRTRITMTQGSAVGDACIALNYYGLGIGWTTDFQVITIGRGTSNVGIGLGNTIPTKRLHVAQSGTGNVARFTAGGAESSIQFENDNRIYSVGVRDISNKNDAYFVHDNGASVDRFTINTSGQMHVIGAGTTINNVNTGELQIGAGIASAGTAGSVQRLAMQPYGHTGGPWTFTARDTSSVAYLDIGYGAGADVTFDSSGNVSVGATAAQDGVKFYVAGAIQTSSGVNMRNSGGSSVSLAKINGTENQYGNVSTNIASTLSLMTHGYKRLFINDSGIIGIGTENPDSDTQLEIQSDQANRKVSLLIDTTGVAAGAEDEVYGLFANMISANDTGDSGGRNTAGVYANYKHNLSKGRGSAIRGHAYSIIYGDGGDRITSAGAGVYGSCQIQDANGSGNGVGVRGEVQVHPAGSGGCETWAGHFENKETTGTVTGLFAYASGASGASAYGTTAYFKHVGTNMYNQVLHNITTSGTRHMLQFKIGASTEIGSITCTDSATSYNTTSDYRLKENVDYTWDATTRLKQLKPARFNFIVDPGNTIDGFLAHEVSSLVPEAITGEKDATETYLDEEDEEQTRIKPQGIDQSKLVPLLVKTIQELEARIAALENA